MKKLTLMASITALAIATTGCSGDKTAPEADNVSETQMDEVDVIDGTISDDMVDVDSQESQDAKANEADDAAAENTEKATETE